MKTKKTKDLPPNKLQCVITGKLVYIAQPRLDKMIIKHGSLEQLRKVFVCREARKANNIDKDFRKKPEKRSWTRRTDDEGDHVMKSIDPHDGEKKWFWLHKEFKVRQEANEIFGYQASPEKTRWIQEVISLFQRK